MPHNSYGFCWGQVMTQRERLIARARYEIKDKAQSIAAIKGSLRAMLPIVAALNQRVGAEEARTRIRDTKHTAYSTIAIAARARSDNLQKSSALLEERLAAATAEHGRLLATLAVLENIEATRLVRLPLRDAPTAKLPRDARQRRIYPLRTVTVIAPSNDNLACARDRHHQTSGPCLSPTVCEQTRQRRLNSAIAPERLVPRP
jgi:flagellar protein FliJ